jgi:hypothetical protein
MEPRGEPTTVTDEELDAILADEAGETVEEFREDAAVELTVPWESEIVEDHGESPR